jgi:hypothetical protein
MKTFNHRTITCAVAAILAGSAALAFEPAPPVDPESVQPARPDRPELPKLPKTDHAAPVIPEQESMSIKTVPNAGFGTTSAFTSSTSASVTPDTTTLTPPVSISYSGGAAPVLTINDTGTNRGVSSIISNTHNNVSALFGQTNGGGAGLTGYNYGTTGPAGKFGLVNASSSQPAVFATSNGKGPAVLGTITTVDSSYPALFGQNTTTAGYGIGVEGQGNEYGVYGTSPNGYGLYGSTTNGYGVLGYSQNGDGVLAESSAGYGLYAYSSSSDAIYGYSGSGTGMNLYGGGSYGIYVESKGTGLYATSDGGSHGITAHSTSGIGLYASSDTNYGIWGQSKNTFAVIGEDSGSGTGVYGSSATGYAGYFAGKVGATSYVTVSDRNAKTNFKSIDGKSILEKVSQMPVTSWVFKTDLQKQHVGPMAQDFHAAFGLDGQDDKHINLTDIAGISLAAIKELSSEMKVKDAQIADLKRQLSAQTQAMAEMKSMAEMVSTRMTALENQRGVIQTVSLKTQRGAAPGASE